MIPQRLTLEHFMCYREEQSLDFAGIHLACVTGDNGHGKSALLDAITWAIWGEARARRDDELITLGEMEMWVDLEFELSGQRYRVWRQRSRRGRGQSDLHFYIWNAGAADWQMLDDGGLAQRQAQINRTLRIEYKTFINSSMLLQGRADSFTVKSAGERKQILTDILGLEHYDLYEERAKAELSECKSRSARLQSEIQVIGLELARRQEFQEQLIRARAEAAEASTALAKLETERGRLRTELESRRFQAQQLRLLQERLARAERDQALARTHLAAAETQISQTDTILAARKEIEEGWRELQESQEALRSSDERSRIHNRIVAEANKAKSLVTEARMGLEVERRALGDRIAELERRLAERDAHAQSLSAAQAGLAQMAQCQERRDAIALELRTQFEEATGIKQANDQIRDAGKATSEKALLLQEAEASACPLCRQSLDLTQRDAMLEEFAAERAAYAIRWQENQEALRRLDRHRLALEAEEQTLAKELRGRDAFQRQAAQAERALAEIAAAVEARAGLEAQAVVLDQTLTSEAYAGEARRALAQAEGEMAAVAYQADQHDALAAQVLLLTPFAERYQRELLPALDGAERLRQQRDALQAQIEVRELEMAEDRLASQELGEAVADLQGLEKVLVRLSATVQEAARVERLARQQEGAAMQQLQALQVLAEKRQALTQSVARLNEEISIFSELREAFGKKGLQAMIIESVIPEIETEANRLLSRMTEGRMNLRLETQRQKVTGGQAETLDIIISDELGARAYELYSGGEAFRANLALRIAISKLLARRAGAELQTLVIDEGFGTQDTRGRDLLVDAINSIHEDFARVLVITHIDELKDLFPARIDVVKTPSGSRVSLA